MLSAKLNAELEGANTESEAMEVGDLVLDIIQTITPGNDYYYIYRDESGKYGHWLVPPERNIQTVLDVGYFKYLRGEPDSIQYVPLTPRKPE